MIFRLCLGIEVGAVDSRVGGDGFEYWILRNSEGNVQGMVLEEVCDAESVVLSGRRSRGWARPAGCRIGRKRMRYNKRKDMLTLLLSNKPHQRKQVERK